MCVGIYLEPKGSEREGGRERERECIGRDGGRVRERERVIPRDKVEGSKGRCRERRKDGGIDIRREVSEIN